MTKDGGRAPYQSPLRARLKEQTSNIILSAVGDVLRAADLSAVSIAEVARVAEVTESTVYRHYPTRDELIRAFIKWHLEASVGGPNLTPPDTIDGVLQWLATRYSSWAEDHKIVSEAYLSPAGRELRKPLYDLAFKNLLRLLALEYPKTNPEMRRIVAASMLTLMSTENFVFLCNNLGYGPEEVHQTVVRSIGAMLRGLDTPAPTPA